MVRLPHQFPEEYAPGSTPRQIILTLILPERAAKIHLFFRSARLFQRKRIFSANIFTTFSRNMIFMANSASQIRKANLIFHSLNNTFYILEKR